MVKNLMMMMMLSGDGWSQGREILGHGEEKDYEGVLGGWFAPVIRELSVGETGLGILDG